MELKEPLDRKLPSGPISPAIDTSNEALDDALDEALKFLAREQQAGVVLSITETRALRWRIDLHIVPLLMAIYFLQYLDKTLLNYAADMGIKDFLPGNDYNNLGTIFYVGYLVAEPVTAYLMQRWPIAKYLGVNVACWGVLVACHAACRSYASLMVVRVLLGVCEACVAPALVLITGMWWTKPEQARRTGLWYMQIGVAQIVGAGISYGFQQVHSDRLANWQILFLFMARQTTEAKAFKLTSIGMLHSPSRHPHHPLPPRQPHDSGFSESRSASPSSSTCASTRPASRTSGSSRTRLSSSCSGTSRPGRCSSSRSSP